MMTTISCTVNSKN